MKYTTLLTLLFLALMSCSLQAQDPAKPQIWLSANTTFGLLDFDPFKLGLGGNFQLNFRKPFKTKSMVGLSFGVNRMGNYNRVYGEYSYDILPSGFQYTNKVNRLQSLTFFDAGIHFIHRPKFKSPWSWSVGINGSLLIYPAGQKYTHHSVSVREPEVTEDSFVDALISSAAEGWSSLPEDDFSVYDISVEAALHYQIAKGCTLQAGFRQGTQNLIKPSFSSATDARHYLSMFTLGFSTRLR